MTETFVIVNDVAEAELAAKGQVLAEIEEHTLPNGTGSSVVFVFRDGTRVAVARPDIQLLEVCHADS